MQNRVFFLPVNTLTVLHAASFLAARHTTVYLDLVYTSIAMHTSRGRGSNLYEGGWPDPDLWK